jgi:phosphatidate phosphatase APP1
MSRPRPPLLFNLAYEASAFSARVTRAARRRLGIHRPLHILPYRGYGTLERALIKARVLEDNGAPPPETGRAVLPSVLVSYKRFATVEIPGARVRVHWDGATHEATTDDEGFLDLWVRPPHDATPGWHPVRITLDEPGEQASTTAQVLLVGPETEMGVISDLDDTVIITGVRNLLLRAWALFMSEAADRLPFDGVRAYYEALRNGSSGNANNPIFYVSSSPWNLYAHLVHLLDGYGVPQGPLLLRDWGLTRHGFAPGGGHGHKKGKIREIMDAFPGIPFLLIGDSGQQDPEHYTAIAQERPDQVLAIHIRDVTANRRRERELEELAARVRAAGSEMVLIPDSDAAARHAAARGWIRWQAPPPGR